MQKNHNLPANAPLTLSLLAVIAALVLPFALHPARFEPHEPTRAALLGLFSLLALPALIRRIRITRRHPLTWALLGWLAALLLATITAYNPLRAALGEPLRQMGLLTLAALTLLVWAAPRPLPLMRWLFVAGVVVSAEVLLRPTGASGRAAGLFGVATYSGEWLALVMVGCVAVGPASVRDRWPLWGAGLLLMGTALLVTQARGAALGLLCGLLTWVLVQAAARQRRGLALAGLTTLLLMLGSAGLLRGGLYPAGLANAPLVGRLNPLVTDETRLGRERVWTNTRVIVADWPPYPGEVAPPPWRTVTGYGLTNFNTAFAGQVGQNANLPDRNRTVDRAHNEAYDTLVTSGWLGLTARVILYGTVAAVALARLGLMRWTFWGLAALLMAAGGILFYRSVYLPHALSGAFLLALWLWLVFWAFRWQSPMPTAPPDPAALAALVMGLAGLVQWQWSFITVASAVPVSLAMGLLLPGEETAPPAAVSRVEAAALGLAAALLLRSIGLATPLLAFGLVLVLLLTAWAVGMRVPPGVMAVFVAAGAALAWAGHAPYAALPLELALLLGAGLWALGWPRRVGIYALAAAAGLVWLWGAAADIALGQVFDEPMPAHAALAARLRPYDDVTPSLSALWLWEVSHMGLPEEAQTQLNAAAEWAAQAGRLNPYHATHPYVLALVQVELATYSEPGTAAFSAPEAAFAEAIRLAPAWPDVWRERARYRLILLGDAPGAAADARTALRLDPNDEAARRILEQAAP